VLIKHDTAVAEEKERFLGYLKMNAERTHK